MDPRFLGLQTSRAFSNRIQVIHKLDQKKSHNLAY